MIFPNSQRINRGNYVVKDLVDACKANDVTDLIIVHEHRGEPGENFLLYIYNFLFIYLFIYLYFFKY